jgi:predicted permease
MSILSRFLNRWRERTLSREFDEEIEFHLEQRAERNRRAGMDAAAARAEARRHFGNLTLAREDMRRARVATWIDDLGSDLRYAVRIFARQPVLTGIAVVTLSLGIGANAAIYSVLNAVLLRPFPFPDADRLVLVNERLRSGGGTSPTIPEILDIRARTRSLDAVTFYDTRNTQVDGSAEPARVEAARVDPALLPLLSVRPALGRLLTAEDSSEGSARVLLLTDGFWRRNFGAAPDVIGRTMMVDGAAHTVVGVLPAEFSFPWFSSEIGLFVPYPLVPLYTERTGEFANVRRVFTIGRLEPGISFEAASADLASITAGLVAEHPQLYKDFGGVDNFIIELQPLRESIGDSYWRTLVMLFGAVTVVLLIACVNAAQFLLSHAIEREPEVALRSALGAGRPRLVRQFLSETLLLACTAAVLGLLQAYALVRVLRSQMPGMLMVGQIDVDVRVLGFLAFLALTTTLVCGLVPSLQFSRTRLRTNLEARGSTGPRSRTRHILIAVEVALSVVLLVQAALLMRSLDVLRRSQAGFSPQTVMAMRIRGMVPGGAGSGIKYQQYLEHIAELPDIAHAAISSGVVPGSPGTPFNVVRPPDSGPAPTRQNTSYQIVSPGYFRVLGIPLLQGRTFATTDTSATTPVAVVNEHMARRNWPDRDPIGQQIRAGVGPREATLTIVGVVGSVRTMGQSEDTPQLYVSYLQQSEPNMFVLTRPAAGRAVPIDAVKRAIWSVEPRQAVFNILPLEELLGQRLQNHRVVALILGGFALLACVMSVAGVFAVISHLTSRRLKEIALRRAIGAQQSDILFLLAGQTFAWTLIGLAAGTVVSQLASRTLRANIPGLVTLHPAIVAATSAAFLIVVAVATILPALQGLRVDPASALRAE